MSLALRVAPPATVSSEHELVASVRRGDERAFEELYSRYRKRIAGYVLGFVGDHSRAEDITQEVFISALRRMRDTERPIAFKPWIYEIAKNACIDYLRRARRAQEVSLDAEQDLGLALDPPLSGPPLEVTVEARQKLDDLRGAFGCLSESHHQVLVLRELEGLSYAQIGERMGISRAVVESTLFRARRRLGEEFEELISGRRCEHVQAVVARPRARALGLRERRQLARHLAHCQPCRRHAHIAGFDSSTLKPARVAGRIAAWLPVPLVRLRGVWRSRATPRQPATASVWQSPVMLRSVDTLARVADPSGGSIAFGRAAAAIAAVALTTTGGGLLIGTPGATHGSHSLSRPAAAASTRQGPATYGAGAGQSAGHTALRQRFIGGGGTLPHVRSVLLFSSGRQAAPLAGAAHPHSGPGRSSLGDALGAGGSALSGGASVPPGLPKLHVSSPAAPPVPKLPATGGLPTSRPSAPAVPGLGAAGLHSVQSALGMRSPHK